MGVGLREKKTLLEMAAIGTRSVELSDSLEAIAIDPSMPSGTALDWTRDVPANRELALFVRAQLGVDPTHATRIRTLAETFHDPVARDSCA